MPSSFVRPHPHLVKCHGKVQCHSKVEFGHGREMDTAKMNTQSLQNFEKGPKKFLRGWG